MDYIIKFPDPHTADDEGLVAVGGELSVDFLEAAYKQGIFPWFDENNPILWWSPNPRFVLYPNEFKLSKSLSKLVKRGKFELRIDTNFRAVIENCATMKRAGESGTWITNDMLKAYNELHLQAYAHSFETYLDNELVGGLYGVSYGKAFFGESMFHKVTDASKFAFYYLVEWCKQNEFHFIDAQLPTNHLRSLGAKEVERSVFLEELEIALQYESCRGPWGF